MYDRLSAKEKNYLLKLYYNIGKVGSLGTAKSLYKLVKQEQKYNLTLNEIRAFLSSVDTFTVFKQVKRKKVQVPRLYSSGIDQIWQGDLLEFNSKYKKDNHSYVALLIIIDIFSRFCWFAKLKSTGAEDLIKGFDEILDKSKPRVCKAFSSDMGPNFTSKKFIKYLQDKGIKQIILNAPSKAWYCERLIKTIQEKIHKIFYHNQSYQWEPYIEDIIDQKNNSYHYGLKNIPSHVNKNNEREIFYMQYLPPDKIKKKQKKKKIVPNKPKKFKFKIGQKVRILAHRAAFNHSYQENFSEEYFYIKRSYIRGTIPVYILEDVEKNEIKGPFYEYELQGIVIPKNYHFKIAKILRYKTQNKKKYALIAWYGFREQTWILASQIKDYKDTR